MERPPKKGLKTQVTISGILDIMRICFPHPIAVLEHDRYIDCLGWLAVNLQELFPV
jgi:hypothetical protein